MKSLCARLLATFMLTVVFVVQTMAQNGFAYQAVIRDSEGNLVTQGEVGLQFSLMNAGKTYYVEAKKAAPDKYGNISVIIGDGKTKVSGSFDEVPWSTLDVTLKVEVDVTGGTNYKLLGETKLNPVPYALYATQGGGAATVNSATKDGESLFQVNDRNGNPVFAVTENGIVVYVDDTESSDKLRRSGFLVTGREATKGEPAKEYFSVTTDGTQIYVDGDDSKLRRSGFLVTGREATKDGQTNEYLTVDGTGTKVYVDMDGDDSKLRRSGFLVTGREATKANPDSYRDRLFAIDGGLTTIYIDGENSDKLRRSGFLVTGREATKGEPINYVDVSTSAINLVTETLTVSNNVPSSEQTVVAPAPVLTIANKKVEMESDVVLEGELVPAELIVSDKQYTFDLELAYGNINAIKVEWLLKKAGIDINNVDFENFDESSKLMYAIENVLVNGFTLEIDMFSYLSLSFDNFGQRCDYYSDKALEISGGYDGWEEAYYVNFAARDKLTNQPIKFAIQYSDKDGQMQQVIFTANVTTNSMIYPYEFEKGTLVYSYKNQSNTDNIYYCFNDYGFDNFVGIDKYGVTPSEGRAYNYVIRVNEDQKYQYNSIDNAYGEWWSYNASPNDFMKWPFFSLAGVNTSIISNYEPFALGAKGLSGIEDFDINAMVLNGQTEYKVGDFPYDVDQYQYQKGEGSDIITYVFYVHEGVVLGIDAYDSEFRTTNILICTEFKKNEAESSFHRWLKNSGVTNYDGIASGMLENATDYGDEHFYVDLGLPSGNLWAATNVGAPSPYDWGDYLAWGETTEKENYSSDNWPGSVTQTYWDWAENPNSWTVPNSADWQELISNCMWVWVKSEGGVYVCAVSDNHNNGIPPEFKGKSYTVDDFYEIEELVDSDINNYIFLPAAGFANLSQIDEYGRGYYWASNKSQTEADCFDFNIDSEEKFVMQVHNNSCWRGLQVRPVVHKNTKYYVKINSPSLEPNGTKDRPFASINDAVSFIKDDVDDDQLKTYTIMIDGEVGPAEIRDVYGIKQITLCGANGLDANNMPKDAIVGDITSRPLAIYGGRIIIKSLKLTGGGVDPDNPERQSEIDKEGRGGGLYVTSSVVILDSGAVVTGNAAIEGGGVYCGSATIYLRGNAKICNNIANGGTSEKGIGGGVSLSDPASLYMEGGIISGNKCKGGGHVYNGTRIYSQGGGVYVAYHTTFEMYGGIITGNSIEAEYIDEPEYTIKSSAGGGIWAATDCSFHLYGGEISGNTSTDGADVYCKTATIGGSTYIGNICVFAELNNNNYYRTSAIEIGDKLTTDKKMSLTFNLSFSDQLELGECKPFYVLYNRNNNGQIVRDAMNIFESKDSEYELEYGKDGSFCFGKLVKKQ